MIKLLFCDSLHLEIVNVSWPKAQPLGLRHHEHWSQSPVFSFEKLSDLPVHLPYFRISAVLSKLILNQLDAEFPWVNWILRVLVVNDNWVVVLERIMLRKLRVVFNWTDMVVGDSFIRAHRALIVSMLSFRQKSLDFMPTFHMLIFMFFAFTKSDASV